MITVLAALFQYHPYGGLQKDSLRFFLELANRGARVIVFTTRWEGEIPHANIIVEQISIPRFLPNHVRMNYFVKLFQKRLTDKRKPQFDVSVAMSRIPGADYYFAADVCMKTYWRKQHPDFICRFLPRYRTYLKLERDVFSPESRTEIACIVTSQIIDYTREYGTQAKRFFLLPPGMDPKSRRSDEATVLSIRNKIRKQAGIAQDAIGIVMAANSVFNKGTDRAIDAIAALPPAIREKIHILLVGMLPQDVLSKQLKAYGLLSQATFFGPVNGIHEYLLASDLLLHPARNEAAGSVLIEAIADGIPVLTTDICGFANYVSESGNIVLPSPFSQTSLDHALREMIPQLSALQKNTIAYAKHADFYSRAKVFANHILSSY